MLNNTFKLSRKNTAIIPISLFCSASAFAHQAIEPVMVTIPAGNFEMGSTARNSSQPIHSVKLNEFSLGKYEVTVKEFRQFIEATGYEAPTECRHEMDGWFKLFTKGNWEANALNTSDYQPVVCIDWNAANAYVNWLAKETGKPYRLPSEAEWEYAARAKTKEDYYFGNSATDANVCEYENTGDLYGENILQRDSNTSYFNWTGEITNCSDHAGYASIVGMYKANPFGLHDMVSNVREMLADCWSSNYENAPTDNKPNLKGDCKERVTRGSSWHWSLWPITQRGSTGVDFSGGVDGFRIALDGKAPSPSKVTKKFQQQLEVTQDQEKKRWALHPAAPEPISDLELVQTEHGVTLSWAESKTEGTISYRVYRNPIAGKMFRVIATNITDTHYTDTLAGQHKYEYTVVAVKDNQQSHYATPVATEPQSLSIAGKIEAEWSHEFSGTAISFSSDNERTGNTLTGREGISDTAQIHYHIDVAESGVYQLEFRVAANRDTKGVEVQLNDKPVGNAKFASTGGYHDWQTQQGPRIRLTKGQHTLTLNSLDKNWKLNWLALRKS